MQAVQDNSEQSNKGGAWRLVCKSTPNCFMDSESEDENTNPEDTSSGFWQAARVWNLLSSIHNDAPDLFSRPPNYVAFERTGRSSIFCNTPDRYDEVKIRLAAEFIRSRVNFPWTMYYLEDKPNKDRRQLFLHTPEGELYKKDEHGWKIMTKDPSSNDLPDATVLSRMLLCFGVDNHPNELDECRQLPSEVIDSDYLCMPSTKEGESNMSWAKGGKWMVFSPGNSLENHDAAWTALLSLYRKGILVGLKASTSVINPANTCQGPGSFKRTDPVIHCYTADSTKDDVFKTAVAIRCAVKYDYLMFYKTNSASQNGSNYHEGKISVSKYQHTVEGGLYERDNLNRFEMIFPGK